MKELVIRTPRGAPRRHVAGVLIPMNRKSQSKSTPRSYRARSCACGARAAYVVQVQARTLGVGSFRNRKTRFGATVLLCDDCSLDLKRRVDDLESSASEALNHVRRRPAVGGDHLPFD